MNAIHPTNTKIVMGILSCGILAAACFASIPAQAAFVSNGSFEFPNTSPGTVMNINAGTEPAGFAWTVTTGNVDIVRNGFAGSTATAYDGAQMLDLVGSGSIGGISLLLPTTTVGTQYTLSFAYANNPFNGPTTASASVSLLDGASPLFSESITHNASSAFNYNWASFNRVFTGTGDPVTLAFDNTIAIAGGNGGILLDAISLTPVPVPAAIWLFGTGLAALSVRSLRLWHRRIQEGE